MCKCALLTYHKNAQSIYKKEWIDQYRTSVLYQTHKEFDVVECNYGNDDYRIFENSIFFKNAAGNFVETLNWLLDKCFFDLNYDFVGNSNVDDFFSLDRIEKQLPYLQTGFDIVSSNFALVQDDQIIKFHEFHNLNIGAELSKNHNVICHPSVFYSRNFWMNNRYIPEQQPMEDMMLWQRSVNKFKFVILKENLLYHRIHDNAVCRSDNK